MFISRAINRAPIDERIVVADVEWNENYVCVPASCICTDRPTASAIKAAILH